MKAKEVLRRYDLGERDFRRTNLRGQSFKGKKLSGADFSEADIRGANFTRTTLREANFSKVKTGFLPHRIVLLIIGLLIPLILAIGIVPTVTFFLLICGLWVILGFLAVSKNGLGGWYLNEADIQQLSKAGANDWASEYKALDIWWVVRVVFLSPGAYSALSCAATGGILIIFHRMITNPFSVEFLSSTAPEFFPIYLFGSILIILVLIASDYYLDDFIDYAFGFVSFQGADLTDAIFEKANLLGANFTGSICTRTRWFGARNFKRNLTPGRKIFDERLLTSKLAVTYEGHGKIFDGLNLEGINLQGANLSGASFIGANLNHANLQKANLFEANLKQTQLDGTDLTGATLTGACVEDWGITGSTKLEEVECQYVFLLERPNALGHRERRPHNPDKMFERGDFVRLYQKIMTTVQLLLRDGIHPEAFKAAFEQLRQENPEITPDVIQAIERKGNDVLMMLTVPENVDKSGIERKWDESYKRFKLEAEKDAVRLGCANRQIETLMEIILAFASNQGKRQLNPINLTINAISESKAMSDSNNPNISTGSGSFVNAGNLEMTGGMVNLGEISGNVTNTINQLQQSSNPEAAQLADLLKQLQTVIEAEPALKLEAKAKVLEQVDNLGKAGLQEGTLKKLAATAIKILKGTIDSLPSATQTVGEVTKLVGAIATLLALS